MQAKARVVLKFLRKLAFENDLSDRYRGRVSVFFDGWDYPFCFTASFFAWSIQRSSTIREAWSNS